ILDRPLPDPADPFEMRSGPIWLGRSGDFDPGQSPATALGAALILKGESNHVLDTSLPIAGIDDCWPRADRQPGIELQLGGVNDGERRLGRASRGLRGGLGVGYFDWAVDVQMAVPLRPEWATSFMVPPPFHPTGPL